MKTSCRYISPVVWLLCLAVGVAHSQLEGSAIEGASYLRRAAGQSSVQQPKVSTVSTELQGLFEAVNETTYVVGPGDYFQIVFGEKSEFAEVNSEGYVTIEATPPLRVADETLLLAKRAIQKAVSTQYKSESIHVTLAQAKVFQVSIAGEVNGPGLYSFVSGTRLSTALDRVGWFSFMATQGIELTSASGKTRHLNLGEYFSNGDLDQNPYLSQGDRIIAPKLDFSADVVYIRKERRQRPMQIGAGENLEDILRRHENFRGGWEWNSVRVFAGGKYQETVLRENARNYVPKPGTVLDVRTLKDVVFVGGTVVQPGLFSYDPRFSVQDYVAMGGITINTSRDLEGAIVIDADGNRRDIVSPKDPAQPGDHIWVPRSSEAKTRDYVGLISSVSSLAVAIATLVLLVGTR